MTRRLVVVRRTSASNYLETKCSKVKEVRAAVTENPRSLGRLELMLVFLPILPRFSLRQRLRLLDAFAASPTAAPLAAAAVWSFAIPFLNEREREREKELGGARACGRTMVRMYGHFC